MAEPSDDRAREAHNRIQLSGTVSRTPQVKRLRSGDELVVLRLLVRRPDDSRADSIEVAVGPAPGRGRHRRPGQALGATVRRAASLPEGRQVSVVGHLERRFWRSGEGTRTRLQVVAHELTTC